MRDLWQNFWYCFVPIFVAMDAIGTLPLFVAMTAGLERVRVRRIILQSMLTAAAVATVFIAVGQGVFDLLGITAEDFMVAGGVLLFLFAINSLLTLSEEKPVVDPESLGAVPLGVPLIVGPAVLTTALILISRRGIRATALATIINIAIAGGIFSLAEPVNRLLGNTGAKIISKLASLLLGAIAVMMVRRALTKVVTGEWPV